MIDYNDLNFSNKKLSNGQKQVIFEQLYNYFNLQNSNFKNLAYQKDANGKLILPKGTLLHGTGETYGKKSFITQEQLQSISKNGIIAPEFFGSAEQFNETYYCADFFKVTESQTLHEYSKTHREYVLGNTKQIAPEANYLPVLNQKDIIAFIIQPNKNEIFNKLLDFDIYKSNEHKKFMQSLTGNVSYIYHLEWADRLSSILVGLPVNTFSGIWISKNLNTSQTLNTLKQYFSDCFIVDNSGEFLFEPHPECATVIKNEKLEQF